MKRIAFLFFASLMLSTIVCQAQQYNTEMLKAKVLRFSKMRNTGFVMIGTGTLFTIGGVVLISNTDWNKTTNGGNVNYQTNDPNGLGGILLTVVGVGLGGAGTALAIIGTNRSRKYSKLLYNVRIVPLIKSDQSGIMLTYRF